ncbi:hypothetical protein SOMG_00572 [Schizosaccharomyces osmophilus]|uniref:Uncharacterized protein n=1 Tax=Schizosaccharomyces osmophilus TaxID=2545709 RepID=A0AAE9W9M2_9SCHI|nr:uncharacterized protein SOMG_00572 [Schizosaccharomyces osmophilus]WBW72209.1 hypothetical protein SOMG_00572 [Schizosaccharomyces osmophilus]
MSASKQTVTVFTPTLNLLMCTMPCLDPLISYYELQGQGGIPRAEGFYLGNLDVNNFIVIST